LTQIDSSSPPIYFYGSGEDSTEVVPRRERTGNAESLRTGRQDDFRPSSKLDENGFGNNFRIIQNLAPKIRPRYDYKEEVELTEDRNLELKQVRHRAGQDSYEDIELKQDRGHPEDDIELRLGQYHLEDDVEPRQVRGHPEDDGVPRRDRMDDFEPFGGLVPINETLLMAVGLVNEKVSFFTF